jgi:hypothetical protein
MHILAIAAGRPAAAEAIVSRKMEKTEQIEMELGNAGAVRPSAAPDTRRAAVSPFSVCLRLCGKRVQVEAPSHLVLGQTAKLLTFVQSQIMFCQISVHRSGYCYVLE